MSRFGKYLGFMEIKVGEETLEVRPTLRHKQKLLGLQQNAKKGNKNSNLRFRGRPNSTKNRHLELF